MKYTPIIIIIAVLLTSACTTQDATKKSTEQVTQPSTDTVKINPLNTTANQTQTEITTETISDTFENHQGNLTIYVISTFSTAVKLPTNELIIIDAGTLTNAEKTLNTIKDIGYAQADTIILTNSISNRIGGVPLLMSRLKPTQGYHNGIGDENSEDYRYAKTWMSNLTKVGADTIILKENIQLRLIVPYDDGTGFRSQPEQNSIIVKITYKDFSITFGSDCVGECEERTTTDSNLQAQILTMPFQGRCESQTVSTYFINAVGAEINIGDHICDTVQVKVGISGKKTIDTQEAMIAITSDGKTHSYYKTSKR